ncbi:hypothetical protein PR048_008240 [Dryococelus australis]|uniref:Uncharacterized protein n=1 Tax=Dryococelus australis TaxID=614101 RepID=A0ABQ9HWJ6_9NEOP|nr:hypothetical protein PR048_008240 [Dryococelus australis]
MPGVCIHGFVPQQTIRYSVSSIILSESAPRAFTTESFPDSDCRGSLSAAYNGRLLFMLTSRLDFRALCAIVHMPISHWLRAATVESDDWAYILLCVSHWLRVLQEVSNNAWTNGENLATAERKGGETGDPRENPPTSGIDQHDSLLRKFGRKEGVGGMKTPLEAPRGGQEVSDQHEAVPGDACRGMIGAGGCAVSHALLLHCQWGLLSEKPFPIYHIIVHTSEKARLAGLLVHTSFVGFLNSFSKKIKCVRKSPTAYILAPPPPPVRLGVVKFRGLITYPDWLNYLLGRVKCLQTNHVGAVSTLPNSAWPGQIWKHLLKQTTTNGNRQTAIGCKGKLVLVHCCPFSVHAAEPITNLEPRESERISTTHNEHARDPWQKCKLASKKAQHGTNDSVPCDSSPDATVAKFRENISRQVFTFDCFMQKGRGIQWALHATVKLEESDYNRGARYPRMQMNRSCLRNPCMRLRHRTSLHRGCKPEAVGGGMRDDRITTYALSLSPLDHVHPPRPDNRINVGSNEMELNLKLHYPISLPPPPSTTLVVASPALGIWGVADFRSTMMTFIKRALGLVRLPGTTHDTLQSCEAWMTEGSLSLLKCGLGLNYSPAWNKLRLPLRDKIDVKHVYTEVDFSIGSQFIRHALDGSEPLADFQGYK